MNMTNHQPFIVDQVTATREIFHKYFTEHRYVLQVQFSNTVNMKSKC